ncbi:MAG: hypothetical protein GY771_15390, partial [bacterium]|nr:hypothetical protein [bacterium]
AGGAEGRGHGGARRVSGALHGAGLGRELRLTGGPGDARAWCEQRDADVDLIVSVGGDGTLMNFRISPKSAAEKAFWTAI